MIDKWMNWIMDKDLPRNMQHFRCVTIPSLVIGIPISVLFTVILLITLLTLLNK